MQLLQKIMCWIFAAAAVVHTVLFVRGIVYLLLQRGALRGLLLSTFFSAVVAVISGAGWWSLWKEKPSARDWVVAASFMCILVFLKPFDFASRPDPTRDVGALIIGLAGLFVLLWHRKQQESTERAKG